MLGIAPLQDGHVQQWSLVVEPIGVVKELVAKGNDPRIVTRHTEDGDVRVMQREWLVGLDGARVSCVPEEWGKTLAVIKLKLSGGKQGCTQLKIFQNV